MAFSEFKHALITGISVIVPKNIIRLEDEIEYFGGSLKKVQRVKTIIGLDSRRVADKGVTASDLCAQAAENLFSGMNVDKSDIDALIFVSQGPDHAIPATACILQDKLGLSKDIAAFDVNQGCTAYVYGLWLASSMVESGACRKVLVLVGEAGAIYSDPDNRVITPIFGDCGTATLVEHTDKEVASWYSLGTDGSGAEALMVPAGHARFPLPAEHYKEFTEPVRDANNNPWYLTSTYMDGGAIFDFTMTVVPEHIKSFMERAGHSPQTLAYAILHQANKQIAHAVAVKSGFTVEQAPTETVAKYGNQSGASLPSVIADQLCNEVGNGDLRLLLSGYGVGLSWASAIVTLDHIWCSGIREYENSETQRTPEEMESYWRDKFKNSGKTGE